MHRRKIQLIAGTTYSVSLPKEWIKKNGLKEQDEVMISEKNDRTLVVSPHSIEGKKLKEISLNVDEYLHNIDQIIFAVYYMGIEKIVLFSKKEITKEIKAMVRKTLTHMSGSEISYEDKQKITIRVLLDKSKVDIIQVLYRISLIIDLSIADMLGEMDINEIRLNELEIDRLYHLITKIISLSLIDSNILYSSKIRNVSLIPSFFLIGKKLENFGDGINHLSEYLMTSKKNFQGKEEILNFMKNQINRSMKHLISKPAGIFKKADQKEHNRTKEDIHKIKDDVIADYLDDMLRYVIDIQEEMVNVSFYNKLISENLL
jgi:phosphate uptake regulator